MRYPIHTSLKWSTVEDKQAIYGDKLTVVSDFSDLKKALDEGKNNHCFFRGQRNSMWKLVSSAQRIWRTLRNVKPNTKYETGFGRFLSERILKWKKRINVNSRLEVKDHHLWGFLQHYSASTPFLDFSSNPLVALHFATRHHSGNDPFSIYLWNGLQQKSDHINDLMDLDDFIGTMPDKDSEEFTYWGQLHPSRSDCSRAREFDPNDDEGEVIFEINKSGKQWPSCITEGRMTLQEGLFVFFPRQEISLDEFVADHKLGSNGMASSCIFSNLRCIDCDSRLINEVKEMLKENNVTDETLGLTPSATDERIKQELVKFENAFVQE